MAAADWTNGGRSVGAGTSAVRAHRFSKAGLTIGIADITQPGMPRRPPRRL